VLAFVARLGWRITDRSGLPWHRDGRRPVTAAAPGELQSVFHAGQRHAIEQRRLELVLHDDGDGQDGAPPRVRVDPDRNRVVITGPLRPPEHGPGVA
jgi:hypothetical protein